MSRHALLILYRSYILPLLDYGDVIYNNISTADSCRLENVETAAAKLFLGCMQTTSHLKILNELSMSPLQLRRNCHIFFAFRKIPLGPCPTFIATLTPKLFRDLSNHSLRHVMNVQLPSCRTALFHSSFFLKVSKLWNSLPTSVQLLGPNLFQSKVTALICGKSYQVLHLCGVNPRATSWLCMLRLSHSPLNPDYKHYRLCSCGLSLTESHIFLECDLTRTPRQVMLNSIRNILLKEQVFTLSQLNILNQAAWKRMLLLGHAKLKRPSIFQLYDAVCDFQQLWRICNESCFLRLGAQRSLSMLYYHSFLFCVFIYYCFISVSFFASICWLFTIMLSQVIPADGTPGSVLPSFAVK